MFCQVELVKYYIRTGDLSEGDRQYNLLTEQFSENPRLASNICFIGDTYLRAADIDTANLLYNRVLTTWPDDPQSIFAKAGLAKVAAQLGRDSEVAQILDEILSTYPDNPDLARSIFSIGEEYWNLAKAENKKTSTRLIGRVRTNQSDKSRDHYTKGKDIWERIIKDMPTSSIANEAYHYAAETYKQLGQYEKAIEYFQIVADNWPDYELSSYCRFVTIALYKNLRDTGAMTESEAELKIKSAFEKLIVNHPDNTYANAANRWLADYAERKSGK